MQKSTLPASLFDGVSLAAALGLLDDVERRTLPAGAVVIAPGDAPRELYIVYEGTLDVYLVDGNGREHHINRLGPGAPVGEMSLLTGQPASALVRTAGETTLIVLHEEAFHRLAEAFPRIYRNLGAILSQRLVNADRRSLREHATGAIQLANVAAPPLLPYALACSIAWHTRRRTLLLLLGATSPSAVGLPESAFCAMAGSADEGVRLYRPVAGTAVAAHVACFDDPTDVTPALVNGVVNEHRNRYGKFLVCTGPELTEQGSDDPRVLLAGAHLPAGTTGALPAARFTVRAWLDGGDRLRVDVDGRLDVPAPEPADYEQLLAGVLSLRTPLGRALGWAARDLSGLKVGLALGAGSAKGFAHVGVLRVLEQADIPVDYVAGTSIGAAVAALHARGDSEDAIVRTLDDTARALVRLGVPTASLLSSAGLRALAQKTGGVTRFEALNRPLALVAADLATREEVVFRSGLVWPALLASVSLPGIYPPQQIDNRLLVDGGILNPVPSSIVADMGASTVLAVRLSRRPGGVEPVRRTPAGKRSRLSVIRTILSSIETMQSKISATTASAATIVIEPEFGQAVYGGLRDFRRGREFIPLGEAAAVAALPRVAAALPWTRYSLKDER